MSDFISLVHYMMFSKKATACLKAIGGTLMSTCSPKISYVDTAKGAGSRMKEAGN